MPRCRAELALRTIVANSSDSGYSLEAAADVVGLSRWYVSRILVRETGYGFGGHMRRLRMMRAVLLMERPELSVKEIAARAGFSSTSEMDRKFRGQFRTTPSEFRRAAIE